jgi:hypothetical protein
MLVELEDEVIGSDAECRRITTQFGLGRNLACLAAVKNCFLGNDEICRVKAPKA